LFILLHAAVFLAMLPGIFKLTFDNSPEIFFARNTEAIEEYHFLQKNFEGGRALRITLSGSQIWTRPGLTHLSDLEDSISSVKGIKTVLSPASYHRWLMLQWPPSDPEAFKQNVLEDGLDRGIGWISPGGETISIWVVLEELPKKSLGKTLVALEDLLLQSPPGIEARLSGLPVIQKAMDRSLIKITLQFLPLLVLITILFLFLIFRRMSEVYIPIFYVFTSLVFVFGIMGYAGERINVITVVSAPLLFVISLATAIHILVCFLDQSKKNAVNEEAVLKTYRIKSWPVFWTGVTTFIAFGSLYAGNMPPIRSLGIWTASGIFIMTFLSFSLFPALLTHSSRSDKGTYTAWAEKRGRLWSAWAADHRKVVLILKAFLIAAALLGIIRLRVNDNLARYFHSRHPVRVELNRLQDQGIGIYAAEMILSLETNPQGRNWIERSGFQNPEAQLRLAGLSRSLRTDEMVYGSVCSGDLLEAVIRSVLVGGEVTDDIRWLALGLMQSGIESRRLLHAFMTPEGKNARITFLVPILSYNTMEPLFERMKSAALSAFPQANISLTGQYPLILMAQKTLVRGLASSFLLTLLCVVLILFLLLRRFKLTLLVLLPNLWPILIVFGSMGWLKFSLDSTSIMTASVILGLAVDDTLHSLGFFLKKSELIGGRKAIIFTLKKTAPAHIATSLILTSGFGACALSDFLPVARLGSVAAAAIVLALLGDLFLIPALLSGRIFPGSKGKKNIEKRS
jgi:predicted RND superfamily exporter protein